MCTHCHMIYNPYIRKRVLVSCGYCPSCLQEKANARANRIVNHTRSGFISLFVTLTYDNQFLPFVYRDDICSFKDIPIYRSASVRCYRDNIIYNDGIHQIDSVWLSDSDLLDLDLDKCPSPNKMSHDKIGVICYSDIQDFFKRLRINLHRLGYDIEITYFSCAEIGPTTKRPHFHLLIFIRSEYEETVRSAIVKSWPFADKLRTSRFIEIAKNAASYVASYVNCGNDVPKFYKISAFRQKHSFSKGFGTYLECFSLSQILEKSERQDLSYNRITYKDGVPCIVTLPIPKYVINKYFPKFKGYSVVTDDEIRKLLLVPSRLAAYVRRQREVLAWSSDEVYEFKVRLNHIADEFVQKLNISYDEFWANYPEWYIRVWNARFCTVFRNSYLDVSDGCYDDFYENVNELSLGIVHSDVHFIHPQENPNLRKDILFHSNRLTELYFKKDKSKKVVNYAMSQTGFFV